MAMVVFVLPEKPVLLPAKPGTRRAAPAVARGVEQLEFGGALLRHDDTHRQHSGKLFDEMCANHRSSRN